MAPAYMQSKSSHVSRRSLFLLLLVVGILTFVVSLGFFMPQRLVYPVLGANVNDWNKDSFWFEPWGASGVHKGIDIFKKRGTEVVASSSGLVVYRGQLELGGNVVIILGPKWRMHYYAHLDSISIRTGNVVRAGDQIGTVGTSGNAVGKEPHLHYVIQSLVPYPRRYRAGVQGWKRMFYLDPGEELRTSQMTSD
jgi:murein DD-endopeptidase MepM/ murein hydrolase activator NlpD